MNLQQTLKGAATKLKHLESPNLEAEVLLAALLNQSRTWLKTHSNDELSLNEQAKFNDWIQKRANHIPTAYITGFVMWSELKIKVTPDTLIPRDETETLCHHLKAEHLTAPQTILDVGTGSGCIALWCKHHFAEAKVSALDISKPALAVAQSNAKVHQLNIEFMQSDLLGSLLPTAHFDLIVANLPYVPESITVTAEVETEPHSAIFSDNKGLLHIERLHTELQTKHITFKQLWLEFLPSQADAVTEIFSHYEVKPFPAIDGQIFFAQIKPRV